VRRTQGTAPEEEIMSKRIAEAQARRAAEEARRKACLIPFTEEEWHLWENGDEEYVVPLIKKYLRTPGQASELFAMDYTIEDALNGRIAGEENHKTVTAMFTDWNQKLGYKHFGS
jgi:hypothetical protein